MILDLFEVQELIFPCLVNLIFEELVPVFPFELFNCDLLELFRVVADDSILQLT